MYELLSILKQEKKIVKLEMYILYIYEETGKTLSPYLECVAILRPCDFSLLLSDISPHRFHLGTGLCYVLQIWVGLF